MSRKLLKGTNWLLAAVLGLLGFTGCDILGGGRAEYGTPHADYTVKGKVVDKETKEPIEGIGVKLGPTEYPIAQHSSVTTGVTGEFEVTRQGFPEMDLTLYVDDIDGEENGAYASESLDIDFSGAEHIGGSGHWDHGDFTVTQNVELTEVETQE